MWCATTPNYDSDKKWARCSPITDKDVIQCLMEQEEKAESERKAAEAKKKEAEKADAERKAAEAKKKEAEKAESERKAAEAKKEAEKAEAERKTAEAKIRLQEEVRKDCTQVKTFTTLNHTYKLHLNKAMKGQGTAKQKMLGFTFKTKDNALECAKSCDIDQECKSFVFKPHNPTTNTPTCTHKKSSDTDIMHDTTYTSCLFIKHE